MPTTSVFKISSFSIFVIVLLGFAALFAPIIAPYDPMAQDLKNSFLPPFWLGGTSEHLLGTDSLGRDLLSRIIFGARAAVYVSVIGSFFAALIGVVLGLLSGYFGGALDALISRLVDAWMSFPSVLLCIVLAAVIGPGLETVIVAIIIIDWTRFCRVVRSETIVQKSSDYVSAAIIGGLSPLKILIKEVFPNIAPLLVTLLTLEMGIAIVVEAILSFVGFSSSHIPTWGGLIQEGRLYVNQAWWVMGAPVFCIVVVVLAFNLIGDSVRKRIDPVLRA